MLRREVVAVYLLALMGAWCPFACILAGLRGLIIGNFIINVDEELFERAFDWLWLSPVKRIVAWGYRPQESDRSENATAWRGVR